MTRMVFVTENGVGLDTEDEVQKFVEKDLKPRLLELLCVILHHKFTVKSVEIKRLGAHDPFPKITVELDGSVMPEAKNFVERWLRLEHPGVLKET